MTQMCEAHGPYDDIWHKCPTCHEERKNQQRILNEKRKAKSAADASAVSSHQISLP